MTKDTYFPPVTGYRITRRRAVSLFVFTLAALGSTWPAELRADSLASASTYYTIRNDPRLCISPVCGGFFVKGVNQDSTRCADGEFSSECYVAEVDWSRLDLTDEQIAAFERAINEGRALVRGSIRRKIYGGFGNLGVFVATEAWEGKGVNPVSGSFFRVYDNGIRCITYPCFSIHEALLNSKVHRNISDLDLSQTGASKEDIAEAYAVLARDSLLVAGKNVTVPKAGPAGDGVTLVATQFYFRVDPKQ